MRKKIFILFIIILSIFCNACKEKASGKLYSIEVAGKRLNVSSLLLGEDEIGLPAKEIADSLGYVTKETKDEKLTIEKDNVIEIDYQTGSVKINQLIRPLKHSPVLYDGSAFLLAEELGDLLQFHMEIDGDTLIISPTGGNAMVTQTLRGKVRDPSFPSFTPKPKTSTKTAPTPKPNAPKHKIFTIDVISHRGSPNKEIEHTFASYDHAISEGSKNIELDLVASKDGEVFVSHDFNLYRLTGTKLDLRKSNAIDILTCKVKNGENIHTLEEVFIRYGKKINYVVETRWDNGKYIAEDKLLKLAKQYGLDDKITIQSFSIDSLSYINKKNKNFSFMLLVSQKRIKERISFTFLNYPFIDIYCFRSDLIDVDTTNLFHSFHKKVFAYFANELKHDAKQILPLGIDGFFTNYTAESIKAVKDYLQG